MPPKKQPRFAYFEVKERIRDRIAAGELRRRGLACAFGAAATLLVVVEGLPERRIPSTG